MLFLRTIPLIILALVLLAPSFSEARGGKIQSFVIAQDQESVSMASRIGASIESALDQREDLDLLDLGEALAARPPAALEAAREQALGEMRQGVQLLNAQHYAEAVSVFSKAVSIHRNYAAWINHFPEHEDALAYLAAAYVLSGHEGHGREIYRDLLIIRPRYTIDPNRFPASLQEIVSSVRKEIQNQQQSTLEVTTSPPGARVMLSGLDRGVTPVRIDQLAPGRHLLRLEQYGAVPHGKMVEVPAAEERTYSVTMEATPDFQGLQDLLRDVTDEIRSRTLGRAMLTVGMGLELDLAIFGLVRRMEQSHLLKVMLVDIGKREIVSARRFEPSPSEMTLEAEVAGLVAALLRESPSRRQRRERPPDDPLSGRSGTEGWTIDEPKEEPRRGRRSTEDPLSGRDGTEDW